jgi:hypothetical protein
VETLVAASPAVSIRLDVLSEFSELGIRFEKDLSNAVTLANVLDSIRYGAPAWLLGLERGNQLWEPHDVEDAPEIVGERGQAELGAHLLQPSHQKRTLVHPLLDCAKRVFDRVVALVEDAGTLCYGVRIASLSTNASALAAYRQVGYQPYEAIYEKIIGTG